jgi:hypothetical protein
MSAALKVAGRNAMLAAALAVVAGSAFAQSRMPRYEPSTRVRLPAEVRCMSDEVEHGAACVKKCQADFRLDLEAKPPACIGTKVDARYEPPKPEFTTPAPKGGSPAGKGSL